MNIEQLAEEIKQKCPFKKGNLCEKYQHVYTFCNGICCFVVDRLYLAKKNL